jgi:tripartite-type tricarboxylate transporter receptor subunit TctC
MTLKTKALGLAAGALLVMAGPSIGADWEPSGDLKLQIGFGAGGSTDTMGRVLAKVMEEQTGWNIIAENKPGGGGVAMFTGIAKMPPKGNVIGLGVSMPILVNLVNRGDQLPFDLDSFEYLGTISKAEVALIASKDAPFEDLEGLIEHAKLNGGTAVAFGAPPQKLLMEVAARESGAEFSMVTTKGGAESMQFILGGQVLAGFGTGEHLPYLESGDMKVIAGGNEERLSYSPDTMTFVESGINAYVDPYYFLAMTKGTSAEAVDAIANAIDAAMQSPEMAEIIKNATKGNPLNLGPDGTKNMLVGGIDNVRVLFQK